MRYGCRIIVVAEDEGGSWTIRDPLGISDLKLASEFTDTSNTNCYPASLKTG